MGGNTTFNTRLAKAKLRGRALNGHWHIAPGPYTVSHLLHGRSTRDCRNIQSSKLADSLARVCRAYIERMFAGINSSVTMMLYPRDGGSGRFNGREIRSKTHRIQCITIALSQRRSIR